MTSLKNRPASVSIHRMTKKMGEGEEEVGTPLSPPQSPRKKKDKIDSKTRAAAAAVQQWRQLQRTACREDRDGKLSRRSRNIVGAILLRSICARAGC